MNFTDIRTYLSISILSDIIFGLPLDKSELCYGRVILQANQRYGYLRGGPFWTRARDRSLIGIDNIVSKSHRQVDLHTYIAQWCQELKLEGAADITIGNYLGRIRSLLRERPKPGIQDIKNYYLLNNKPGIYQGQ